MTSSCSYFCWTVSPSNKAQLTYWKSFGAQTSKTVERLVNEAAKKVAA
ncbi:hypothetical protein [Comamonas testosteroni]|nr:hypothetical protein [Comamonas testosteroni]KWT67713.1 hypothetical protein APV28_3518 [Comamonas testosteroni]